MRFVAAMLLFSLPLLASAGGEEWGKRELTKAEQKAIEQAVRAALKDPDSAEFQWQKLSVEPLDPPGEYVYCGYVNAKNGFGGYVGYKRFMVIMREDKGHVLAVLDGIEGRDKDLPECDMHEYQ